MPAARSPGWRSATTAGRSVAPGPAAGGGAGSELWLKIVASVHELPLERIAVEEGAAYGAALLGGVAGGMWADVHEAVAACVRTHSEVEPVSEWIGAERSGGG